ncbi:MAG: mucoidy inhibitor MuiA family protein, partial [bacterium]
NRALVVREASLNLVQGKHEIVLSALPFDLLDESVRVSGTGSAKAGILDVKIETEHTAAIQDKEIKILQQKIDSLQLEDQKASDQIAILEAQKSFVESLKAETARDISQKIMINKPAIQDWQDIVQFFNKNLSQIFEGLRREKSRRKELDNERQAVERKISQIRSSQARSYKQIKTTLVIEESGNAKIHASYFVNGASWYPVYDARVLSATKKMELTYYGMVQQATGEDWKNVKLTLSTVQPLTTSSLPELRPLFIEVDQPASFSGLGRAGAISPYSVTYHRDESLPSGAGAISGKVMDRETGEPLPGANLVIAGGKWGAAADANGNFVFRDVPVGQYDLKASFIGYQSVNMNIAVREKQNLNLDIVMNASALQTGEAAVAVAEKQSLQQEFTYSLANIETNLLTSIFEIPVENDIPGDNSPHKVTIRIESMNIEFQYTTIPKLLEKTFLQGKIVNQSGFPLSAGPINVFLENDFVNKNFIPNVVPNDTLTLSVGIDEGIKVSRKLVNRFLESKGLLGGKKKVTFEYEIMLTNTKTTEESVNVMDQLPISRNEKIKIELLEPNARDVQIDNQKRIKWLVRLKPGETKRLPLKYQIEFPKEVEVSGLE